MLYYVGMKVRIVAGTAGVTYLEADSMLGKKYTYVSLLAKRLVYEYINKLHYFLIRYVDL
jgi:hypothetical protein